MLFLIQLVPCIQEFYKKCLSSQELIVAQIPWATAGAERSRAQALESRRSAEIDYGNANANSETQLTREEKLLAELLKANEELAEALKIYADLERIDVEKEIVKVATERSQTETRMNGFVSIVSVVSMYILVIKAEWM